jgi:hypothetical protein
MNIDTKSLEELRALAKKLGLTGYSKLRKPELLHLLAAAQKTAPANSVSAGEKTRSAALKTKKQPGKRAATGTTVSRKSGPEKVNSAVSAAPTATSAATDANDVEQRVEAAKYAFAPPGVTVREPAYGAEFSEDIDRLPDISTPLLCILPQKPGIFLGYWVLPPGQTLPHEPLKLRLAHVGAGAVDILDEVALPNRRGYWYFHVGETVDTGGIYLQLGYYATDGRFVSAIERGIARVPSLYASSRTDRRWWVSEERFRAMYERAGGTLRGTHLGWAGSISSPGGAPGAGAERLAWPGNVSSR